MATIAKPFAQLSCYVPIASLYGMLPNNVIDNPDFWGRVDSTSLNSDVSNKAYIMWGVWFPHAQLIPDLQTQKILVTKKVKWYGVMKGKSAMVGMGGA